MVEQKSLYKISISGIEEALTITEYEEVSMQKLLMPQMIPGIRDLYWMIEGTSKIAPEGTSKIEPSLIITSNFTTIDEVIRSAIEYLVSAEEVKMIEIGHHKERLRAIIATPSDTMTRHQTETQTRKGMGEYAPKEVHGLLQFYLVPKK